jgi:exodeoxyribonuclease III
VICLQETKAQPEQVDLELKGYKQFWHSADKKGYSGTAIFTKVPPLAVHYGLPAEFANQFVLTDRYGDTTREGRVLALEFNTFFLVTVYTPNAKDDLSRVPLRTAWDPAFLAYLKKLEIKKPVVACGDFNVAHTELDLARPKENLGKKGFTTEERAGFSAFMAAGFVDTFRHCYPDRPGQYTWWSHWGNARSKNVGWRIDYFIASAALASCVTDAAIHSDITGSDHCPVTLEVTIK